MNKLFAGYCLVASMALSSMPALAEVDAGTARGVMQESGLWDSLNEVPGALREGVRAGVTNAAGALSADASQRLLQAVDASFTVERAQAAALEVVRKSLDATTVAEVRKWNTSPLGKRLLAQEKASAANTDQAKKLADGQAEMQKLDDARRKVLTDIVDATKAVDAMGEMSLGTALTMIRGIAAAGPTPPPGLPSEDQLRGMLQAQLGAAKQQMQIALTSNMAATYASFSTAELQQYLAYLRTPAGAKLNEVTLSALGAVLKDGAAEMGRRLTAPATAPGAG